MTTTPRSKSTRESRATALLNSGAVTLFVGKGYATCQATKGGEYVITRDACTCPDFQKRQVECKHRLVVKQICEEFKALKAAAQRGETVRPSTALLQAIRWPQRATTSPLAVEAAPVEESRHCEDCRAVITRGRWCVLCLDAVLNPAAA